MTLSSSLSPAVKISWRKRPPHSLHVIIYAVAYKAKQCTRQMSVSNWNFMQIWKKNEQTQCECWTKCICHNVRVNFLSFFAIFCFFALFLFYVFSYSQMRRESDARRTQTQKIKSTKINEFYIRKLCFGFPFDVNKNLIYCKCILASAVFFFVHKNESVLVCGWCWIDFIGL